MIPPQVQAGLAVYAAYALFLRHLVNPQGFWFLVDGSLFLYLAYWAIRAPKLPFAWRYAGLWLALPAVYLLWVRPTVSDGLLLVLGCYLTGIGIIKVSRWLSPANVPDSACCN